MVIRYSVAAKRAARAFEKMVIDAQNDLVVNSPAYEGIMRRGTDDHFRRLSWGGTDSSALGGTVSWSRARHPITMRRRRGRGLPLLDTGKGFLRKGVTTGASAIPTGGARGGATLAYRPRDATVHRLLRVHQKGLAPINARRQGYPAGFTVPQRQIIYWDERMADRTKQQIRVAFEAAKRRHST